MAIKTPVKAHFTGSNVTSLGEFESGDTLDSSILDTGTSANQLVKLDSSAKLPAVDGSQLTGIDGLPSQSGNSGKVLTTDGSAASWDDAGINGTSERSTYTATSNQTTFSATYDVGYVDVYLNGLKLVSGTDFTASNGTSIVLAAGATTGDNVDIVAYGTFNVANTYTQTASDAKFAQVSNNLSDLASAAAARTNLGLVIGTDVQAYDANTLSAADGTAGQVLTTDGSGGHTFSDAAGGGNVAEFTASGTLPNGKPVVLKSDGTVEVVSGSTTGVSESIPAGSEYVFNSGSTNEISVSFDPNNAGKFVVCYQDSDNSWYGTAIVGTVSGASISFGSEVVFNSASTYYISVAFDPNNSGKFVVCYQNNGNSSKGIAIVGTVSGTSISFGSEVVFNSGHTYDTSVSFDPNNSGKFVVCYQDGGNSSKGTAIVGTVSGTSISFGSENVFNSGPTSYTLVSFDPNNSGKFVVCYRDYGNSNYGTAIVGTVSGTSISFGSEVVFNSGTTTYNSVSFDPNNAGKFVVCYRDAGNSGYGTACVGTVSGTSISFGSEVVFNSAFTSYNSVSFDPNNAGKFVVCYRDEGNSNYGTAIVGTVSGTSISFGSEVVFNSGSTWFSSVAFDPNNSGKFVVCYKDDGNSNYGTAILGQLAATITTTNLTTSNYIGFSESSYTDGQTASVMLKGGVSTTQSGLTVGSDYYVQVDGTLDTTADTISVEAGKAISATTLLLKGH